MEQYKGNQYEDDLTIGLDDIADESFDAGYVDLFEYESEEESPISRLKNLMLSIEWEITDQILIDFSEELVQAQQHWADDPVKLVYVQALQKITKYIYQKKADAHHNAMKVLLSFFYDLEKIVLDPDISEEEKKEILREDVKKFEKLKRLIGLGPEPEKKIGPLYNLKAHILSIDWEINDKALEGIGHEVKELQSQWSTSKPRMILLQGIDAVGGYIKLMKNDSHADAIKLINSFFMALEKIVEGSLDNSQIKELLVIEADKFNRFREEISDSITPEAIARYKQQRTETGSEAGEAAPAAPIEESKAEPHIPDGDEPEPAAAVDDSDEGDSFSEATLEKVDSFFDGVDREQDAALAALSAEEALRGVEVETEDDDEQGEAELPTLDDGKVAPALSDLEEAERVADDQSLSPPAAAVAGAYQDDEIGEDSVEPALQFDAEGPAPALDDMDEGVLGMDEATFPAGDPTISPPAGSFAKSDLEDEIDEEDVESALLFNAEEPTPALSDMGDAEIPAGDEPVSAPDGGGILGVDVETEEDDDSGEAPLPLDEGELAPALAFTEDDPAASGIPDVDRSGDEINQHVDDFFSGGITEEGGEGAAVNGISEWVADQPEETVVVDDDEATDESTPAEDSVGDIESRLGRFLDEEPQVPDALLPEAEKLAAVKAQVESLKEEISEEKLSKLHSDLDTIKDELADKPIEKIFVHLITTVVDNISNRTAEFDEEAIELLDSVCGNLEKITSAEIDQNQALIGLSNEIAKILQWQQRMLH